MARTAIVNFHNGPAQTVSFYDAEHGDVWNLGDEIRKFCDVDGHGRKVDDFDEFVHDIANHLRDGGWIKAGALHADLLYNIALAKNGQVLVTLSTDSGDVVYNGRAKDAPWFLGTSNPE